MCLELNYKKDFEPIIAETDIIVYKTGKGIRYFYPIYRQDYKYEVGVVQPKVDIVLRGNSIHWKYIGEGYHSCPAVKNSHCSRNAKLGIFMIPKGTKYWTNRSGSSDEYYISYVSETIIFLGFYNIFTRLKLWLTKK